MGIIPIVSCFKNLRRNTLLHADAIRVKPLYFRYVKTHGETHDRIVVDPLHHPDSVLQGLACYGILEACVPRTMLGNPPVLLPHLIHTIIRYARHRPNIIEVFLDVKVVDYHDLVACRPKASGSLRSAHGRKDTLFKNTKCFISYL